MSLRGKVILVTGGTGFLGQAFCSELLRSEPDATVFVLGRGAQQELDARLVLRFGAEVGLRVHGVSADWERAGLGIGAAALRELEQVEEIWHFAALTDLDPWNREEVFAINAAGTVNVLGLAARLPRLRCFNHVSTAYVAGRRRAGEPVRETLDWPEAGFRTPYEESKWIAELSVTRSGLPWRVFRPSIVIGHTKTGACDGKGMYAVARAIASLERHARLSGQPLHRLRVPGDPRARKNLVTVDHAVPVMLAVREHDVGRDTTYHVVARETVVQQRILDVLRRLIDLPHLEFVRPLPRTGLHPAERILPGMLRGFTAYMEEHDPAFVVDNAVRDTGIEAPVIEPATLDFLFRRFLQLETSLPELWEIEEQAAAV